MIITVDGPMASGKSSVAQALAKDLGYSYLNTGFLYRAIAWCMINEYGYTQDALHHPDLALIEKALNDLMYMYDVTEGARIAFRGFDVTPQLKEPEIDQAASIISAIGEVRVLVLKWLRRIAHMQNCVADGRDAGSIIFPDADYKFYLTAIPEIRAKRWLNALKKRDIMLTHQEALDQLNERDYRDIHRTVAPLVVPDGAIMVDNSFMTLAQTISYLLALVQQ